MKIRCPRCNSVSNAVKDSRPADNFSVVRRARHCLDCDRRFYTIERTEGPLRQVSLTKKQEADRLADQALQQAIDFLEKQKSTYVPPKREIDQESEGDHAVH